MNQQPKKRLSLGKVYEGMVELNDSYDVEESVTSSAVFLDSTPDKKKNGNTLGAAAPPAYPTEISTAEATVNSTLPPAPTPPTLLGPSAVDASSDGMLLETSAVVDDVMLGVAAAAPPPPVEEAPSTPPQGKRPSGRGASSSPAKGANAAMSTPTNKKDDGAAPQNGSSDAQLSKVPTTITLPHSIDSSSTNGSLPPLASPLDGDDDDDEEGADNGDHKKRLLRGVRTNHNGRSSSTSNQGTASASALSNDPTAATVALRKRRRCLLLTALVALLVLAAVAGTLGYLLSSSNRSGGSNSTHNSTDTQASKPDNGSSSNGGSGGTTGGQSAGSGGDNATTTTTSTSAPVAAPMAPTPAPTQETDMYRAALQVTPQDVLDDPSTPQGMAIRWLLKPASSSTASSSSTANVKYIPATDDKLLQRYVLTVLEMALRPNGNGASSRSLANSSSSDVVVVGGPVPGYEYVDECKWSGITCGTNSTDASSSSNATTPNTTGMITTLNWANRNMEGKIPTEIGLLTNLQTIDFGNNKLHGWIPYSIYNLSNLQYLYLHQNQLTGPISNRIANLTELVRFYAGNNQLTGTLPTGLGSVGRGANLARPLRYLSLNNNKLGGQLPEDMYWYYMYYLDLGNNQFTGTFPVSWIAQMKKLSTLYIDFNRLTGSLPTNFTYNIGSGRLQQLILSNNHFTGTMPGDFPVINFLQQLELHHNNFTSMDKQMCRQIVFLGGELVNMKADCDVCVCDYFCGTNQCVP